MQLPPKQVTDTVEVDKQVTSVDEADTVLWHPFKVPANGPGTSSQDKAKTSAHIEAVTDKDSVFQNLPPQPSFPKTLDFEASARTPSILSKKSSSAPPFVRLPPLPLHSGDDSGSRVDDDA